MASSPTSIENQIDSFLEQFKRSASRAMEDTRRSSYNASGSISRSRSGNLDLEVLEAVGNMTSKTLSGEGPVSDGIEEETDEPRESDEKRSVTQDHAASPRESPAENSSSRELVRDKALVNNRESKLPSVTGLQDEENVTKEEEESPVEVARRFAIGCECQQEDCCFAGLSPEAVYRHRLNIAELTKAEHDMYLMGVTMACLTDPRQTARNTERRRSRARYVYQGRRVCLDAFLYLENCTRYQIKRIRKHLRQHGVAPRVHGNHGKIPHNTFSLEIYRTATRFLEDFVEERRRRAKTRATKIPIQLPPEITRKTVHELYTRYSRDIGSKVMGYSTFRRFMKVQFPQVKFAKLEFVVRNAISNNNTATTMRTERNTVTSRGKDPREITTVRNNYVIQCLDEDRAAYRLVENGLLVDRDGVPITLGNIEPV